MGSAIIPGSAGVGVWPKGDEGSSWTTHRRVLRAFKIPPLALLTTVFALALGELASGTNLYFISMMAVTLFCIGVTYNMLGGLSRISGFMFAAMAASRIVISQFAKVVLFEPADHNLLVPDLTITVYAVFFLSAMAGVFLFGRIRIALPKPLEPTNSSQTRLLYFVSLIVGVIANAVFYINEFGTIEQKTDTAHGLGLAFSPLLLFSIVLAVDDRIRRTEGEHSLGIWFIVSALAVEFFGYLGTQRMSEAIPLVIYFLSCYVHGYRFRKRHYISGAIGIILFQLVISPFAIYSRPLMSNLSFRERLTRGYELLKSFPGWTAIENAQTDVQTASVRDEYYDTPGTFVLSRLSLIRADSDLIAACSSGFHYGFKALEINLLENVPHILYKNKPDAGTDSLYIEGVIGSDSDKPGYWSYTSTSDSFGAFGWLGVVVFPFFVLPIVFIIYESMFDMARPWGTVALGIVTLAGGIAIAPTLTLAIKQPISLWVFSVLTVGFSRVLTGSGNRNSSPGSPWSRGSSEGAPRVSST